MSMEFNYDYTKTYTTNITRVVGPTTQTGKRGTLVAGPFIYLSPLASGSNGGNDAWTGVNPTNSPAGTGPKATLSAAFATIGGTNGIQIVRNGVIGDLSFTLSADLAFATKSIQVEEGEIAYIDTPNHVITQHYQFMSFSTGKANGLFMKNWAALLLSGSGQLNNCASEAPLQIGTGNPGTTFNINYCIGPIRQFQAFNNGNIHNINNCIITHFLQWEYDQGVGSGFPATTNPQSCYFWFTPTGTSGTVTFNFNRCAFITDLPLTRGPHFMRIENTGVVTAQTVNVNINNSWIDGNNYIIGTNVSGNPAWIFNITFDHCLNNTINLINTVNGEGILSPITQPTNMVINIVQTNALSSVSMFVAYALIYIAWTKKTALSTYPFYRYLGLSLANIYGSSLQRAGKATFDGLGKFFLNSPLIGAGTSSVDINPWDESTTLTSQGYNSNLEVKWPPKSASIENTLVNPVNLHDINGNLHIDYDGERRQFKFNFGGDWAISNEELKQLRELLANRATKQFLPLGTGGNVFEPNTLSSGTFSNTDNSMTTGGEPMIVNHWRGWWITFNSDDYYISSNSTTKLFLTDKLGNGFPADDDYDFIVSYIIVQNEANGISFVQDNFTSFARGGAYREDSAEVRAYDYTTNDLQFWEVEDNEEAPV